MNHREADPFATTKRPERPCLARLRAAKSKAERIPLAYDAALEMMAESGTASAETIMRTIWLTGRSGHPIIRLTQTDAWLAVVRATEALVRREVAA